MPWRSRNSLLKAFEPSSCAGACRGPKHASPRAVKASTTPATSGASGPMMVRSTRSAVASRSSASMSSAATLTLRTFGSLAVPALPGATSTYETRAAAAHFQARACSRPPPPTIRTFIAAASSTSVPEMAHAGEHHGHVVLIGGRDHLRVALAAARADHCANAVARGDVEVVAEREERVRCHHRGRDAELLVGCLRGGEPRGIYPAHLAGPDADGGAVTCEHDGVGLHELAHAPRETQVQQLRRRGLAAGRHRECAFRQVRQVK